MVARMIRATIPRLSWATDRFPLAPTFAFGNFQTVQTLVVKLSDLGFLSQEDLENSASHADLGEKILRQFSFLPGMDLNEPWITALEFFNSGR